MLDPRFRGDDKCTEHPSVTNPLRSVCRTLPWCVGCLDPAEAVGFG